MTRTGIAYRSLKKSGAIYEEYIAILNDLRGFVFFPILLVCFLMLVVLPEIFYGFGFVFIGIYREQSRCA